MPAIITDQFRILNAKTFTESFAGIGTDSSYYTFLAHPKPENIDIEYGKSDWDTNPPDPRDSFEQESSYHNSMLFMKRVYSDDVRMIVPRYNWQSGTVYDRYRHNIDILSPSSVLDAKTLYESKYIVVNSEYKVYICINNGENPSNETGGKSTSEPNFVETVPQKVANSTDGYVWKYLFTIPPSDVIRFVTEDYIPLPKDWGTGSTQTVKDAAIDGKLEVDSIVIKNNGSDYQFSGGVDSITLPVYGDGIGAKATITLGALGTVATAKITTPGYGYTKAFLIFKNKDVPGIGQGYSTGENDITITNGTGAEFEISCPPKGGHGYDIYRECGSHRVMVYSKYDSDPDFVTGNDFARIGIIKNPTTVGTGVGSQIINTSTATTTGALKLSGTNLKYPNNSKITQVLGSNPQVTGISSVAVAYVASFNNKTNVLKYYQPVGLSTLTSTGYKILPFSNDTASGANLNITCDDTTAVVGSIDNTFGGTTGTNTVQLSGTGQVVNLGQTFKNGISPSEVKRYSGEIIYIDNRQPITRSASQKEELKIVVEF